MKMDNPHEIVLKNNTLRPSTLTLTITEATASPSSSILLKIANDKIQSLSHIGTPRKYLFSLEQLEEQTPPLSPGDEYLFSNFSHCKTGKYHLVCLNYPKLECEIQVINEEVPAVNERKSNTIINLSGLESVEEKEEENKEDFGKEDNQQVKSQEEDIVENPLGTPNKAELSDFDKMLTSQNKSEQTMQNRYLRYFQEQFRVWRNFFTDNEPPKEQPPIEQSISTPVKQKPKSQHRKNSENIEQSKMDNWSKRENYSPDIKFTMSCGSPSNNENFSEFDKEKDKTVQSLLNSQDNYRNDQQLQKQSKTMKKTNSEYRLNIQDISQKKQKDSQTDTASKKQNKHKNGSFMEWLDSWASGMEPVELEDREKEKDDGYLVRQWLAHVGNKFRIGKFLYG